MSIIAYYPLYQALCLRQPVFLSEEQKLFFQSFGLSIQNNLLQEPALYDSSPCFDDLPRFAGPLQLSYQWVVTSTLDIAPYSSLNVVHWADGQLAARGQYNRRWCSALGRQLQLTLTLAPVPWSALFPIYALYQILAPLVPERILTFKWPNDLYLDGFKVAGMLTHHMPDRTLISLGLNTTFFQKEPTIQGLWTDRHLISRVELITLWVESLYTLSIRAEELAEFLTHRHLIPQGSACFFSTEQELITFQKITPYGKVVMVNSRGQVFERESGSFILGSSWEGQGL